MKLAPDSQKRWRCSKCDPSIRPGHPGDPDAADEELRLPDKVKRKERGCTRDSDSVAYGWAPELRRCPKSQITPEVSLILSWWRDWRVFQSFPWPGSLFDQPALVSQALRLCAEVDSEIDAEISKKLEEDRRSGPRG